MYFLHKKNSIQAVTRCRYNRDENNWEEWQDDVVPVKGLFDLQIYKNNFLALIFKVWAAFSKNDF
mgnify:CR=1 FL=1